MHTGTSKQFIPIILTIALVNPIFSEVLCYEPYSEFCDARYEDYYEFRYGGSGSDGCDSCHIVHVKVALQNI